MVPHRDPKKKQGFPTDPFYCRNGLSAEKIEVRSGTNSTFFPKKSPFCVILWVGDPILGYNHA